MFYTGLPAYNIMPTQEHWRALKEKNYRIALFKPKNGDIPDWLLNDPETIIIDKSLKGYYD
jgi:hypothetical protein